MGKHVVLASSLAAARAALGSIPRDGLPVFLVSPPGAAAYLGVGFFAALAEAAREEFPRMTILAVMDCGDDAGWALSALRMGFKHVVLRGDARVRARVSAIAKALSAKVWARAPRPNRNFEV